MGFPGQASFLTQEGVTVRGGEQGETGSESRRKGSKESRAEKSPV